MKRLAGVLFAACCAMACGGDDDDDGDGAAACELDPCGGDPVGTWNIVEICEFPDAEFAEILEQCPDATIDTSMIEFTGTVILSDAGTYTSEYVPGGTISITYPADCLDPEATSCDDLPVPEGITCTGNVEESCTCTGPATDDKNPSMEESGTYAVSGTELTMTSSEGDPETSEFCVSGDSLMVIDSDGVSFALERAD